MKGEGSVIWKKLSQIVLGETERCIAGAVEKMATERIVPVFFRADDVAVPGKNLEKLIALFRMRNAPLSLAIVPAWLTERRWQWLAERAGDAVDRWCWHQHGWRHVNHQSKGKKEEFGEEREDQEIRQDLIRGRRRLETLLGERFVPIFTPPWNRCSGATLELLERMNYLAVSRAERSVPKAEAIPDLSVQVDLHTRREKNFQTGWRNLLQELSVSLVEKEACGIMIHHQRMNPVAFEYLDHLLSVFSKSPRIRLTHLGALAGKRDGM